MKNFGATPCGQSSALGCGTRTSLRKYITGFLLLNSTEWLYIVNLIAVRILNSIFQKWGISAPLGQWNISGELCSGVAIDLTNIDNKNYNPLIKCECSANSTCHITQLYVSHFLYPHVLFPMLLNLSDMDMTNE